MKATIITIGDEILIGQILDTNSRYISRALNAHGIVVAERTSIGDNREQIIETLNRSLLQSEIVIITGGLGPTKDDITKHTLCDYFGSTLRYDEAEAEHIRTMLAARNIAFNDLNRGQAMVPECCTVLHNAHGTAPGMWFEREGRVIVSLPGVPFEMQHLIDEEVMPRLKAHFELREIVHRTMITFGIAESILAERIAEWEEALPDCIHLAYLPKDGIIRLRLSSYGEATEEEIQSYINTLLPLISSYLLVEEDISLESLAGRLLKQHGMTIATAESCTGGRLAAALNSQSGSSAYYMGSVVAYDNTIKEQVLGVQEDTLTHHGAVSEQTVREMAEGVRKLMHTDYAIATSGIAGPTGGTPDKPVGTVWIAWATPKGTEAQCFHFGAAREREQITLRAVTEALVRLVECLKSNV